jgi:hypothetical protein
MHVLKQTYVIDDAFTEKETNDIEEIMLRQSWSFHRIGRQKVWSKFQDNKKVLDIMVKRSQVLNPSYSFASVISENYKGVENIQSSEAYEKVTVPVVSRLKQHVNINENTVAISRGFLCVPLDEKQINESQGIHVDNDFDNYTLIYYLNDSDGDTFIFEETMHNCPTHPNTVIPIKKNISDFNIHARIPTKKGRMVLFDGARFHCGMQPRNNYRCVINFNLI